MLEAAQVLRGFVLARRLDRIRDRAVLEAHQRRSLNRLRARVFPRSPFYAPLAGAPWDTLPVMDKASWMAAFDRINTAGVCLAEALAVAERAEALRAFDTSVRGLTVGLSTGSSGRRGVFLVSPAERRLWAGVMLAKLLPERPLAKRSVAFFLRANSPLYEEVARSGRIRFAFFDLLQPVEDSLERLNRLQPDILAGPPSVLRILAELQAAGRLTVHPERLVSIAEVLHADDRRAFQAAFGAPLSEVYQATEGALAVTCEAGRLHLNEAFVLFEREWIDRSAGRFSPVVTDLVRAAQPVVRYRMDDVLVDDPEPCPCGRASATIAAVEGRADDICWFETPVGARVRVFPDFLARAVLGASPDIRDFRIVQNRVGALRVALHAPDERSVAAAVSSAIARLATAVGARFPDIAFEPWTAGRDPKRRRVRAVRIDEPTADA